MYLQTPQGPGSGPPPRRVHASAECKPHKLSKLEKHLAKVGISDTIIDEMHEVDLEKLYCFVASKVNITCVMMSLLENLEVANISSCQCAAIDTVRPYFCYLHVAPAGLSLELQCLACHQKTHCDGSL